MERFSLFFLTCLSRRKNYRQAKNEDGGSSSLKASSAGVHSRMRSALRWRSPENLGYVSENAERPGRGRDVDSAMAEDNFSTTRTRDLSRGVQLLEADGQRGDNAGVLKPKV